MFCEVITLRVDVVVGAERGALELDRLELARLRLLLQRVEIQAGALEQSTRRASRWIQPSSGGCAARGVVAHHVEHGVGVGVLHRRPAVRRRRGLVHDQQAGGALARGFLVLVGPAAVVGHGLAAEVALAGFEVGVVDQHHRDLALQVDALEVVPVALGRLDAVADEHQRRVVDVDVLVAVHRRAHGDLLALRQRLRLAARPSPTASARR